MKFLQGLLIICLVGFLNAQDFPGAAPGGAKDTFQKVEFVSAEKTYNAVTDEFLFSTTTYTFTDVIVFSYFDQSNYKLYDQNGTLIDSVSLNKDEFHTFTPALSIKEEGT